MSGGGPVHTRAPLALSEFVALMATLTALVAVSIDMILPALPAIGTSLGVEHPNDNQLVIAFLFLGFGLGQMFYGPLSDSTGRKPAVYFGLGCYLGGCLLAVFSSNFPMMLAGRFFQGLGVAGPRTITIALVRETFPRKPLRLTGSVSRPQSNRSASMGFWEYNLWIPIFFIMLLGKN